MARTSASLDVQLIFRTMKLAEYFFVIVKFFIYFFACVHFSAEKCSLIFGGIEENVKLQ